MHLDEDRNSINVSAPGSSACPHSDHFGGGFTRKYVLFLFRHLDELTLLMSNSAQPNKAPSLEAVMSSCSAAAEMNTYCRCRHFLTLLQTTPRGSPSLCKLLTCVAVHWLLWRNPFIVRIMKLVTTSRFFCGRRNPQLKVVAALPRRRVPERRWLANSSANLFSPLPSTVHTHTLIHSVSSAPFTLAWQLCHKDEFIVSTAAKTSNLIAPTTN